MPIRLSDLQKQTRALSFEFAGETVNLVYLPAVITPDLMVRFGEMSNAEATARIVQSWDVLGDDDKPLPVTREVCETLPLEFLREIVKEVIEDSAAPKVKKPALNGSFTPVAN